MKNYNYYVYIIASSSGTLYAGLTKSIIKRINEHKNKEIKGFTSRYSCTKLVYYEHFTYVYAAIDREKQIKKWSRKKKEKLVNKLNPHWRDLYNDYINN